MCDFTFTKPTQVAVGDNPCRMAVGDLDTDGNIDIITGNCSSDDLSVLFGKGDGQFEPEQRVPLGARPGEIAIGDFDGDGFKDIVVECSELARLSVFWGQGARGFSPPTSIASPPGPFRLRMLDLDDDGHLDLALLTTFVTGISVIWGDGTRDPAGHTVFPLPFHPNGLEIADLDQDGKSDLATTTCTDSTLYVLLGSGNRQFGPATSALVVPGSFLCMFALGNLNDDQVPDVAIVDDSQLYGRVAIGYGGSGGRFTLAAVAPVGLSPIDVATADFDGDGLGDVAVLNVFSGDVSLLHGGTFEPAGTLRAGASPERIVAADLDDNSAPDLVVMNDGSHSVSIYLNTLKETQVQYDPSVYQLHTVGRALTAEITLPPEIGPQLDPSEVRLVWRSRVLGSASSAVLIDSLEREVHVQFERQLLDMLEAGVQKLSIVGCDRMGSTFHGGSTLTVLPPRKQKLWQASLPGAMPILIRVPDQARPEAMMRIYDCFGRLVRVQRTRVGADDLIAWDGRSNLGHRASSGVYVLVFEGDTGISSCKLIVLR